MSQYKTHIRLMMLKFWTILIMFLVVEHCYIEFYKQVRHFAKVTEHYWVYLSRRTRVFDGYQESKPKITNIIKDHCSTRHALISDIVFDDNTNALISQYIFFTKNKSKEKVHRFVGSKTWNVGYKVVRCPSDTNTKIV